MEVLDTLGKICFFIVIPYVIYLHRTIHDMQTRIETKLSRPDILDLIDLKKEVTDFQYQSLKEDIEEIKLKIDRLIATIRSNN